MTAQVRSESCAAPSRTRRPASVAPLADELLLDQHFDNGYALGLGWRPDRVSLLQDIATGSYAA